MVQNNLIKMKKVILSLVALLIINLTSYSQTTKQDWSKMMESYKNSVESILSKECPKNMELEKFRTSLILGENKLSSNGLNEISRLTSPLKDYGKEFATKHKLELTDEASLIFYSSFSPDIVISNGELIGAKVGASGPGLTWAEVGNCALIALGADAAWAWAAGSGTSWSMAALTTTFTGVAKRFLGPIGVGIAVGSFSYCLYHSYYN